MPKDPDDWVEHIKSLDWMNPTIAEWMDDRLSLWGAPSSSNSLVTNTDLMWNAIPAMLTGFFDDGVYAGLSQICDSIDNAIFKLMDVGVEAQMKKFERMWMDQTIATRISKTEWGPRAPGAMVVLGKQFNLRNLTKCDTPERLASASALLRAILHQAHEEKGSVFESSLRRALGIITFITDSCVFMRTNLRGIIKGLTAAGSWQKSKIPATSSDYAWRMAQACYHGANFYDTGDPAAFTRWLNDWRSLPLGRKCKLPKSCDGQFAALLENLSVFNSQAFMPRRSPVPADQTIYLMLDSAGLSKEDPLSKRACGGWAYCSRWNELKWFQERWDQTVLEVCHSTIMEAASGLSILEYAINHWPATAYVEIYDSSAAVDIIRSMSSRSIMMRKLLKIRFDLLAAHPGVRALPHWQSRKEGWIADCFTKYLNEEYTKALYQRLPDLPLAEHAEPKPPNAINSPAFAAQWTEKENEAFDD